MNWSTPSWSILLERPSGPVALSDSSLRILEHSSSRPNGALRSVSGDWVSAACGSLAAASTAFADASSHGDCEVVTKMVSYSIPILVPGLCALALGFCYLARSPPGWVCRC